MNHFLNFSPQGIQKWPFLLRKKIQTKLHERVLTLSREQHAKSLHASFWQITSLEEEAAPQL
jgi:hypothetical protein